MPEELKAWDGDISRAYVLLRVTLGLNICLHGVVRWTKGLHSFAESLVPYFRKSPSAALDRVLLRIHPPDSRSSRWCSRSVWAADSTCAPRRLYPHAGPHVRIVIT